MFNTILTYTLASSTLLTSFVTAEHYHAKYWNQVEAWGLAQYQAKTDLLKRSITNEIDRPLPLVSPKTTLQLIEQAATKYALSPALLRAIVRVESSGNRFAENPSGALGLMQVMKANTKFCGLNHYSQLFDEATNIDCGSKVLSEALSRYHSLPKALIVYNGGDSCLSRPSCSNAASTYTNKVLWAIADTL